MIARTHRCSLSLLMAAGTAVALSPAMPRAEAVVLVWNNAGGGNAAVGSNWTPNQVPTAADILNFNLNANYAVNFFAPATAALQMNFNAGTVGLLCSNPTAVSGQFVVGLNAGSNATASVTGELNSAGILVVGGGTGSTGLLNLPAEPSVVSASSAAGVRIGNGGAGTLNVTGRGVLRATGGPISFGALAGSQGTATISGSDGATRSRLEATHPTAGDITIGTLGPGSLSVVGGGRVAAADDFSIAPNAGVVGQVTVASVTSHPSAIDAADLFVAANATPGAAAGSATLSILPGALVTVAGVTSVGDPDGGTGTLNLSGGLLSTRTLAVQPGAGTLNHTGGELRFSPGGSFSTTAGPLIIQGASSSNPAHLHFQGSTGTLVSGMAVASTGFGVLTVDEGAVVTAAPGPGFLMSLGSAGGSEGTINVSGAGSLLANGSNNGMSIGGNGRGTVNVFAGARLDARSVTLATGPQGRGDIFVSGGGRVDALTVQIGQQGGGVASVNLASSAQFNAQNLSLSPSSSLSLDDAVLTLDTPGGNTADLRGSTTMANGAEIAADTVLIRGPLQGSGNVYGNVTIEAGAAVNALGGDLFLGSPSNGTAGFANLGTLNVGAAAVHILDGDGAPGGDITIAGGHLFGPPLTLGATDSLSGFGGISAPMNFNSAVIEATTSDGIVFNAPVFASSPCIWFGTKFTFAAGCHLSASGGIPTQIVSEEEAIITAVSSFILGDNDIDGAVDIAGTLNVGGAAVTLRSDTPAQLGVLTTIAGGTLTGPADNTRVVNINPFPLPPQQVTVTDAVPLVLSPGDILRGFGEVATKLSTAPGSQVIAQGPLALRGSGVPPFFSPLPEGNQVVPWNGDLVVGPHQVTFATTHEFGFASTASLAGGSINGFVRVRNLLTGHGSLTGGLANSGIIRPGGAGIGTLTISGSFSNSIGFISPVSGTVDIDLSGDQGFLHDEILVTSGDVSLSGTLNVTILDAEPPPGQVYTILRCPAGTITGTFSTVNLPTLAFGGSLELQYLPSEVRVVVRPACLADFNGDSNLDPDDLADFIGCFFSQPPCPQADFNADGNADPDDLSDYIGQFFGGCP